jgi:hypothetical protein
MSNFQDNILPTVDGKIRKMYDDVLKTIIDSNDRNVKSKKKIMAEQIYLKS